MYGSRAFIRALLAMLILLPPLLGQASLTVTGVVEDGSGAAISGAKVTVVRQDSNESQEIASDENGNFSFKDVFPGIYVLKIEMRGFEPYEKALTLGPPGPKPLRIKLKVGTVKQQVTVDADADEISTSESDSATTRADDDLLRKLPTLSDDILLLIEKFISPAAQAPAGASILTHRLEASESDLPAPPLTHITTA